MTLYIACSFHKLGISIATGGFFIERTLEGASLYISNCKFKGNGHFGQINSSGSWNLNSSGENYEISDGAAIKVFHPDEMVPPINITIEYTTFISNRGRSGGAINIFSYHSLNIR